MPNTSIHIPNFYEYLKIENIDQENLTEADYVELRKKFYRYRNKLYKKRQRLTKKECVLYFNSLDYTFLNVKAKEHQLQIAEFIKQSTLSYSKSTYLVPDRMQLKEILLKLENIEQEISKISKGKHINTFMYLNKFHQLSELVSQIQNQVLNSITNPINADEWIKREISDNKDYRKQIIKLLLNEDP